MSNQAEYDEIEINLIEFCWKLVEQWKLVVLCAVIGAVLLGGYKFVSDDKAAKTTSKAEVLSEKDLEKKLSDEELQMVDNAVRAHDSVENLQDYMNNSYLMSMDAYNERIASFEFYIRNSSGLSNEDISIINKSYASYVRSKEFSTDIADRLNWDSDRYVTELIRVYNEPTVSFADDAYIYNALAISIIIPDDTKIEDISQAVSDLISSYDTGIFDKATYQIQMTSESEYITADKDTASLQASNISALDTRTIALETLVGKLDGDSKTLYDMYTTGGTEADKKPETESVAKAGFSVKYAAVGLVLGIMMYAGVLLLWYMFRPRVSRITDVEAVLPGRNAGYISTKRVHNKQPRSLTEQAEEAKSAVEFLAKSMDIGEDSLAYLHWSDITAEHKQLLSEQVSGTFVEIPVDDKETTYKLLTDIKNAVLIFEDEKTPVSKVREIVHLLCRNNSNIIAYVTLG